MLLSDDRRDAFLPLSETGIPPEALRRLEVLGITTLEELRDTWTYGNRQLLTDYLGESPVRFTLFRPAAGLTRGAAAAGPGTSVNLMAAGPARPLVKRARGLALTAAQRKRPAVAPAPTALASARRGAALAAPPVNLIARFPAVRNQGQRGTCVAFSSVAYLEYHLRGASTKSVPRRSEQFLYWACKELDRMPEEEGTTLAAARKAMKDFGVCRNSDWKYQPMPIGPTEGQGPPPAKALAAAKRTLWSKAKALRGNDAAAIRAAIDEGKPVVLGVQTFSNWDLPTVADTGEITLPLPFSMPDGGHAICVVGYEARPGTPGGGVLIFRNSWGRSWARRSRYRAGYGTLFYEYVRLYGIDAYC